MFETFELGLADWSLRSWCLLLWCQAGDGDGELRVVPLQFPWQGLLQVAAKCFLEGTLFRNVLHLKNIYREKLVQAPYFPPKNLSGKQILFLTHLALIIKFDDNVLNSEQWQQWTFRSNPCGYLDMNIALWAFVSPIATTNWILATRACGG